MHLAHEQSASETWVNELYCEFFFNFIFCNVRVARLNISISGSGNRVVSSFCRWIVGQSCLSVSSQPHQKKALQFYIIKEMWRSGRPWQNSEDSSSFFRNVWCRPSSHERLSLKFKLHNFITACLSICLPTCLLFFFTSLQLTLSLPSSKSTFSQPLKEKCICKVVRIGTLVIIFHSSKLWKTKFFILCDVIFLVRLQGKFEIDHSWEWKG